MFDVFYPTVSHHKAVIYLVCSRLLNCIYSVGLGCINLALWRWHPLTQTDNHKNIFKWCNLKGQINSATSTRNS